ncbi:hypothetical protein AAFC00_001440 [Neodothiora populina]|uniref:Uncharacterized protein n=1 Tax=Neodothiora populina TaxID=2781224 RepID=A0ABR3PNX7_9PEZI
MSAATTTQAVRRWVMTGSVAAITMTGAWYGAGLKTQHEFKQEVQARKEASAAERIAQLEVSRTELARKRIAIQKKLDELATKSAKAQDQS